MSSTALPRTMSGVLITEIGNPSVLECRTDLPVLQLAGNQVLVKNTYIGLNCIEILLPEECLPRVYASDDRSRSREHHRRYRRRGAAGLQVGDYVGWMGDRDAYADYICATVIRDKMNLDVYEMYPMNDVARAHEDIEGRQSTGQLTPMV
ncbi:hypothetical protein MMC18_000552 [Xylographa bjoerkii]|nr:hypothetical protein [Xylographa bjoerkii]